MFQKRLENEDFYNAWKKLGFGESLGLMPSIENPGIFETFLIRGVWQTKEAYHLVTDL